MNISIFVIVIAALCGAVFAWGRSSLKNSHNKRKAKDARKDADIANESSKRGSALLDSLSND